MKTRHFQMVLIPLALGLLATYAAAQSSMTKTVREVAPVMGGVTAEAEKIAMDIPDWAFFPEELDERSPREVSDKIDAAIAQALQKRHDRLKEMVEAIPEEAFYPEELDGESIREKSKKVDAVVAGNIQKQ